MLKHGEFNIKRDAQWDVTFREIKRKYHTGKRRWLIPLFACRLPMAGSGLFFQEGAICSYLSGVCLVGSKSTTNVMPQDGGEGHFVLD